MALSADEKTILEMFRYKRPAGSPTEAAFIERFLTPLGFREDEHRNLHLTVGDKPTILFSAHVDTVHRGEGLQSLDYREGVLALSKREKRRGTNCLGADDTAGVWLITELIKAGVSGHYVIHHGEEKGCIGSSALAQHSPDWLAKFSAAIAFDRAGKEDVITHQMGRRTCSEGFARSLSAQLGGRYLPDPTGSYTDTNEYSHVIPECTNISVGYRGQHSSSETQDVSFLIRLRNSLLEVEWGGLTIERDPGVVEWDDDGDRFDQWMRGYGSYGGTYRDGYGAAPRRYSASSFEDLVSLCRDYPEVVANLLEGCGLTALDVEDELSRLGMGDNVPITEYGPGQEDDDAEAA